MTQRRSTKLPCTLVLSLLTMGIAGMTQGQDRRQVLQPTTPSPPYCQVLRASLPGLSPAAFVPPHAFDDAIESAPPDTARLNAAILQCSQVSSRTALRRRPSCS